MPFQPTLARLGVTIRKNGAYSTSTIMCKLLLNRLNCVLAQHSRTCPSHDGILSTMGHKHDWEGIVVKWQKDPEGDWWHRSVCIPLWRESNDHWHPQGAIYNKHCMHDHYEWNELNTVDVYVKFLSFCLANRGPLSFGFCLIYNRVFRK